jgi:hypothetical protein
MLPQPMFGQEGGKKTGEEKVSTMLRIQVIGTDEGSEGPVEGAEVYVKSEAEGVEYEREVSTSSKGIVKLEDVPRGKLLIQVTAEEWVPFGDRFDVNEEEQSIEITLKKPQE